MEDVRPSLETAAQPFLLWIECIRHEKQDTAFWTESEKGGKAILQLGRRPGVAEWG